MSNGKSRTPLPAERLRPKVVVDPVLDSGDDKIPESKGSFISQSEKKAPTTKTTTTKSNAKPRTPLPTERIRPKLIVDPVLDSDDGEAPDSESSLTSQAKKNTPTLMTATTKPNTKPHTPLPDLKSRPVILAEHTRMRPYTIPRPSASRFQGGDAITNQPEWTFEEDSLLCDLRRHRMDWAAISTEIHGRNLDACRDRYVEILRERVGSGEPGKKWKAAEEDLLMELARNGTTWDKVADYLPGRTAAACSSRYWLLHLQANEGSELPGRDGSRSA